MWSKQTLESASSDEAKCYIKKLTAFEKSPVCRIIPKTTQKMQIFDILTKQVIVCSVAVTVLKA